MARRPRPAHRPPPKTAPAPAAILPSRSKPKKSVPLKRAATPDEDDEDEEDAGPDNFFVQGSSKDSGISEDDESEGGDASPEEESADERDADAPRVVQWVDDEEDEEPAEEPTVDMPGDLSTIQASLSALPFGSLRKAQRTLAQATMETDDEDDDADENNDADSASDAPASNDKPAQEWSTRKRTDIAKRAHKHAPMEVTSKRPVSRHRPAIELPKDTSRDPRFAPLTDTLDNRHFATQYAFLPELRAAEHAELRSSLKLARTRLASSPRDQRDARAAEVRRLEAALVRAESAVNRDRRERVEREALEAAKKAERAKQKEGKGAWHMPNAEKKELLVKARYEALAATGGRGAVRKAIERKQKKIGQKEKRSRPYAARSGTDGGEGGDARRRPVPPPGGRPQKRQRFS